MPTPAEILRGLAQIASEQRLAAILWHGAVLVILVALALGFSPRERLARAALAVPLASVSAFAWSYGNPFNAMVFAAWAVLLAVLGVSVPSNRRASRAPRPIALAGFASIAFGWIYPHFHAEGPWWKLLYESPLGLIPCPTLSAVVGLALLGGGLGSRSWTLALAVLGLCYGAFGACRLGVTIDWVLFAASSLLALLGARRCRATGA